MNSLDEKYKKIRDRFRAIWLLADLPCAICGKFLTEEYCQVDHVWPRTVSTIKCHPMNLFCSCGCGNMLDDRRKSPEERVWLIKKHLPGRYEWLKHAAKMYRFPVP